MTSSRTPAPYAAASLAACALAAGLALLLRNSVALYAVVAASFGALAALSSLIAFAGRGLNGVLLGFTIGFLARALLIAVGLFASGARGDSALTYVFSFFGLYAATQIIEVLYVAKAAQGVST